jgi:hypothetical protein
MKLGSVYVNIRANLKPLRAGLKAAKNLVISGLKKITTAVARVAKYTALGFIAISTAAGKMAMDVEESENLFTVSMGKMAASTKKWSEKISDKLGLNRYEVRKYVSIFNVMLESMGIAGDMTAKMSQKLTKLAYDMASFYNLKPAEVFQKLQAGITGEIEPLKRLGILINETAMKTWALNKGLIEEKEKMSEVGKVAVRFMMISEQTAKAQGDLERTMDSSTNVLRTTIALIKELAVDYGNTLLPMINKVLVSIRDWLKENKAVVLDWANKIVGYTKAIIFIFYDWFMMIKEGGKAAEKAFAEMTTVIVNLMKKMWGILKIDVFPMGVEIGTALGRGIWSGLKDEIGPMAKRIGIVLGGIGGFAIAGPLGVGPGALIGAGVGGNIQNKTRYGPHNDNLYPKDHLLHSIGHIQ